MKIITAFALLFMILTSFSVIEKPHKEDHELKEIVKHLEKNFIGKMRKRPHLAKAHFRETIKTEDTYTGYFESLGYAIYMGENYMNVAPYTKYKFYAENSIAKTETSLGTSSCIRESLKFRYYGPFSKHKRVKFAFKILEEENTKEYITLKCSSKKLLNHVFNFAGVRLKIDRESLEVLEASYNTNTLYSSLLGERLNGDVRIKYQYIDEEPFVSSVETEYEKGKVVHKSVLRVLEQKTDHFDLKEKDLWAFTAYANHPLISYEEDEWKKYQITAPNDYDKIVTDLQAIEELTNQYFISKKYRSSDPYPLDGAKVHLELAQNKMNELKGLFN